MTVVTGVFSAAEMTENKGLRMVTGVYCPFASPATIFPSVWAVPSGIPVDTSPPPEIFPPQSSGFGGGNNFSVGYGSAVSFVRRLFIPSNFLRTNICPDGIPAQIALCLVGLPPCMWCAASPICAGRVPRWAQASPGPCSRWARAASPRSSSPSPLRRRTSPASGTSSPGRAYLGARQPL